MLFSATGILDNNNREDMYFCMNREEMFKSD